MPQWVERYREPAGRLIAEATATDFAWQRLAVLTDRFGHRLSGSEGLEQAIRWAVAEMKRDGLENVHTEPVMVPKWVRGRESATMVEPGPHAIVMLGLGDSIGTPTEGVQAEVLVVSSFADLEARAALAKGRIVLFNVPFVSYGDTRTYRTAGPSRAARHGAIAALVRAVGPLGLRTPHTGACSTPWMRPASRRHRSREKTPNGCSVSSTAANGSSCASRWRRASRAKWNRPTSWAS